MMLISVVLPQPDGPTRNVISPERAIKSVPRSTRTVVSPAANDFSTPAQRTAIVLGGVFCGMSFMSYPLKTVAGSTKKTRRRLTVVATSTITPASSATPIATSGRR